MTSLYMDDTLIQPTPRKDGEGKVLMMGSPRLWPHRLYTHLLWCSSPAVVRVKGGLRTARTNQLALEWHMANSRLWGYFVQCAEWGMIEIVERSYGVVIIKLTAPPGVSYD